MDVESPFAAGSSSPAMHSTVRGTLRAGLLVTRVLQLLFALIMAIFSGIWIGYASKSPRTWQQQVISSDFYSITVDRSPAVDALVNAVVAFLISLVSLGLSATWLAFILAPAARSRASCFGNHTPCSRFTCDMSWDIVGSVVWLALFIEFILFYASIPMIAFSAILTVLFIAAAVMSGLQRRRVIREEQQQVQPAPGTVMVAPHGVAMNVNKNYI